MAEQRGAGQARTRTGRELVFIQRPHLHIVPLFGVLQDTPWDRIIVNGRLIVIVAVLLGMPSSVLGCPLPAHLRQ